MSMDSGGSRPRRRVCRLGQGISPGGGGRAHADPILIRLHLMRGDGNPSVRRDNASPRAPSVRFAKRCSARARPAPAAPRGCWDQSFGERNAAEATQDVIREGAVGKGRRALRYQLVTVIHSLHPEPTAESFILREVCSKSRLPFPEIGPHCRAVGISRTQPAIPGLPAAHHPAAHS
jgi:hypothetical protein